MARVAMMTNEELIKELRALVKRTCHTPLLVEGCSVPIDEEQRGLGLRWDLATAKEMLDAIEFQIRLLREANVYLKTQIPALTTLKTTP